MNLAEAFKSIVDIDDAPVVITDLSHTIVYLNPAAPVSYTHLARKINDFFVHFLGLTIYSQFIS